MCFGLCQSRALDFVRKSHLYTILTEREGREVTGKTSPCVRWVKSSAGAGGPSPSAPWHTGPTTPRLGGLSAASAATSLPPDAVVAPALPPTHATEIISEHVSISTQTRRTTTSRYTAVVLLNAERICDALASDNVLFWRGCTCRPTVRRAPSHRPRGTRIRPRRRARRRRRSAPPAPAAGGRCEGGPGPGGRRRRAAGAVRRRRSGTSGGERSGGVCRRRKGRQRRRRRRHDTRSPSRQCAPATTGAGERAARPRRGPNAGRETW